MLFIVTVKLDKNPKHDPRNKVRSGCPVDPYHYGILCTDITGEHHSLLVEAPDDTQAAVVANRHGYRHVTRVEAASLALV